jgi:hypothetical protein
MKGDRPSAGTTALYVSDGLVRRVGDIAKVSIFPGAAPRKQCVSRQDRLYHA